MIKQRILSFGLGLALLGTIGIASTARAGDHVDDFHVTASVADVLSLSVNTTGFSFGEHLNFLGQNANYASCVSSSGATYLGPHNPGVLVTVTTNANYQLERQVHNNNYPDQRLFVFNDASQSSVDCATNAGNRSELEGSHNIGTGDATLADHYYQIYSFDVLIADQDGTYTALIRYVASNT